MFTCFCWKMITSCTVHYLHGLKCILLNLMLVHRLTPPSQAVMAISSTSKFSQKPVGFELLWSTRGDTETGADADKNDADSELCCVWMPVAPQGYVALGCVAERGPSPPSLSLVRCIRSDMVTSGSLSDCIYYCPPDDR